MLSNDLTVQKVIVNIAKSLIRIPDCDLTTIAKVLMLIALRKSWSWSDLVGFLMVGSHLVGVFVVAFVKMDVTDATDFVGCRLILETKNSLVNKLQ
jgi:hypothetical protein